MYCPRCSQEQASDDLRFCSRCGFPLAAVAEVLARGGNLPQIAASKTVFTRRNGKIFALFWAMFFLLMLAPIFDISKIPELASMAAVVGVFGGLLILLASIFFLPKAPKNFNAPQFGGEENWRAQNLRAAPSNINALPPEQSIPVSTYYAQDARGSWRDTKDFIQPSVTENTTRLLEKDEE